ncbi:hypothetical protein GJ608_09415 [Escherichia coli]|nr:recombinase family protein [Escherichia coli]EFN4829986.1 hypothetical protein [Escherichia coli]EID8898329.1 recombinase family protein [Escherichia coli]EJZ0218121.1 recombinase family protein [Escherichia coli]ELL4023462.1 recombinase family protein [Escherichia coli]
MKKLVRTSSAGNALLVCKLNRLGRSMWHLVVLLEELCERGINFRALANLYLPNNGGTNAVKVKQSAISKLLCDFYVSRRYSSETIM